MVSEQWIEGVGTRARTRRARWALGYGRRAWSVSGALLGLVGALACPRLDTYQCLDDQQCMLDGQSGICVASVERCAYEDDDCASGYRFPELTDMGLGRQCMAPQGSSSSGSGGGDGSSSGGGCVLASSGPLTFEAADYAGPIERLHIDTSGSVGVRVVGVEGAVIRDLHIEYAGAAGIVIEDSPGTTIERVALVNRGAPGAREADLNEYGIRVVDSPGVVIRDVTIDDPLTGIQVGDSDDLLVEDIRVTNARGRPVDIGGDCVLVQTSTNVEVRRFFCSNPASEESEVRNAAHAGIFIDGCTNATVSEGLVTNVEHDSGAGVRVHTWTGGSGVEVTGVDVVGGKLSCFNVVDGQEVTFRECRCRSVRDHAWFARDPTGPIRVYEGRYYQVPGNLARCLDSSSGQQSECYEGVFEVFDVELGQFSPRTPPDITGPCALP